MWQCAYALQNTVSGGAESITGVLFDIDRLC